MTILQSASVSDTVTAEPRPAETDRPVEVLVVDDDPLVGKSLTKMLTDLGHRVTLVFDATSALQSISSVDVDVDVLITDYEMPGLNGRELLDMIHSDYPLIPVLVLTGHEDLALAVQLLRAGAVDFLTKPFQPHQIAEAIQRALEQGRQCQRLQDDAVELVAQRTQTAVLTSQLSAILTSAFDPIVTINSRGIIQAAGNAVERVFGWMPQELIGQNISVLMPEPYRSDHDSYMDDYLKRGETHILGRVREFEAVRKDGLTFPCQINVWRVDVPGQKEPLFTGVIRDISERVWREEELTTALSNAQAAVQTKSEFLANMSHEIRTPMTAILGFAENLLDPQLSEADSRGAIQTIYRNARHLLMILNDILDLSKIEAGRFEIECTRFSPFVVVADVVSLMRVRADAKKLTFEVHVDSPIPETVLSDSTRLRQILINLLGNAIKFTKAGGVQLRIRMQEQTEDKPLLRFDVIDSGLGMTEDQLALLFKPFMQADTSLRRKHGGTGLGLAISNRLAAMLGRTIDVRSEPGQGSTFSLLIETGPLEGVPMIESANEASIGERESRAIVAQPTTKLKGRILLAEDGVDNQRLISFVLEKAGAEVTVAENGRIAVDLALAARDQGRPFDVILMDMQMPVLDGYAATRRLRRNDYSDPIIALTAHAMTGDREKCLDAGCDGYTTKPIDRVEFLKLLQGYLRTNR